ncbi:MAG: hypothetical protein JXA20_08150 [Spirochaetes bacterium]|nr:hypothetical protein [Spirochaetota bacterium]
MSRGLKIVIIIAIVIGTLVAGVAGYLCYLGVFSSPQVSVSFTGPYTFAYEEFVGDYKESGPVFDRVYRALATAGFNTTRGIGVYFDNPAEVPADKLRSHCGVLIDRGDAARINLLEKQFKIGRIGLQRSMVAEFPIKGTLSYMIGPMRAYPALADYAKGKGYGIHVSYEVYDENSKTIYYIVPIADGAGEQH